MDEAEFKEAAKRLEQVNAVVSRLDPAMRDEAWTILRGYVSGQTHEANPPDGKGPPKKGSPKASKKAPKKPPPSSPPPDSSEEELIERFESDVDAENLSLVLAIFYRRHGRGPVTTATLKMLAAGLDIDVPDRPDMTLKRRKAHIRKQGDGWKITPGGESWLKETYGVKRGKAPLSEES